MGEEETGSSEFGDVFVKVKKDESVEKKKNKNNDFVEREKSKDDNKSDFKHGRPHITQAGVNLGADKGNL